MGKRKFTNYIVIHSSATPASMDIGAKEIDGWHRAKDYLKIGYHYVIRRDGTIEIGRHVDDIGAHAYGVNKESVGICLIGGTKPDGKTPEQNFTDAQYESLKELLDILRYSYTEAKIVGHRDVYNTACPSFNVSQWLKENNIENPNQVKKRKKSYPTLKRGHQGPWVRHLQKRLSEELEVDGLFGPRTETVVKQFQAFHNLTPDGVVGPRTWNKINEVSS